MEAEDTDAPIQPPEADVDAPEAQPDASEATGGAASGSSDPMDEDAALPEVFAGGAAARSSKKDADKNMFGELLKLGTIMDFGQDFHGGRSRERPSPRLDESWDDRPPSPASSDDDRPGFDGDAPFVVSPSPEPPSRPGR